MNNSEPAKIIFEALKDCGCKPGLAGFGYSIYAGSLLAESPTKKWTANALYTQIAQNFDTKPSVVERSIRYMVSDMLAGGSKENIRRVFGNTTHLTSMDFLYTLKYYASFQAKKGAGK